MQSTAWQRLEAHKQQWTHRHLKDLFTSNPKRFEQYSLEVAGLLFDFSKQKIQDDTVQLLCDLASEKELAFLREQLFSGACINVSENRPALHTALRDPTTTPIIVDGEDIKPNIRKVLEKMEHCSDALRTGKYLSNTGNTFTDVVCLGIGGSDLGPRMACTALQDLKITDIRLHFITNVDAQTIGNLLTTLKPEKTLCIINSKTFTTVETLLNAKTMKQWLLNALGSENKISQHLWAVTSDIKAALDFGISQENIFELWSWVGGRYSIWSAVGLPLVILFGMPVFKAFLSGAHEMDMHFRTAPFSANMPVILGLLGVWNINFLGCKTHAILPYGDNLIELPAYLQQLEMESNGKSIDKHGEMLNYTTAPIIWGGVGCDGQHAYMQLLHQGTEIVPADFLVAVKSNNQANHLKAQQELLVASCFSQSKALMEGSTEYACIGNRPSNTLIFPALTPQILGALLALYEHKVFVQGVVWNINSFDQPGVQFGKVLTHTLLPQLHSLENTQTDTSTAGLIRYYQRFF